jgi:gamma-glutamyl AIG2-like cyclotransferase
MPVRRIEVFFYGLFMDEDLLRAKGVQPVSPRKASVRGFALRIGQRATLIPSSAATVHGMVLSLSHDELELLYSDPTVRAYRPEAVLARLENGETVAALCFNLTQAPPAGEHNEEYAAKLRALAKRLDLPAEYVASIG